jgi:hypothetical protein
VIVFQDHLVCELLALLTGDESFTRCNGARSSAYMLPSWCIRVFVDKGVNFYKYV